MPVDDFATAVKRLAENRGMSVAQVGFDANDRSIRGTNPDTLKSVMAGRRAVSVVLMEAVARVLRVEPEEFWEYRLALARQRLDEREVGLDQAVATLTQIEAALQEPATDSVLEATQEDSTATPDQEADDEDENRAAG